MQSSFGELPVERYWFNLTSPHNLLMKLHKLSPTHWRLPSNLHDLKIAKSEQICLKRVKPVLFNGYRKYAVAIATRIQTTQTKDYCIPRKCRGQKKSFLNLDMWCSILISFHLSIMCTLTKECSCEYCVCVCVCMREAYICTFYFFFLIYFIHRKVNFVRCTYLFYSISIGRQEDPSANAYDPSRHVLYLDTTRQRAILMCQAYKFIKIKKLQFSEKTY